MDKPIIHLHTDITRAIFRLDPLANTGGSTSGGVIAWQTFTESRRLEGIVNCSSDDHEQKVRLQEIENK